MTRHNLNQHLHWLLGSLPTAPPQPAFAPLIISSVEDASPSSQDVDHLESYLVVEDADGNVNSSARQPEFVRPTTPASVLNNRAGNEMARLQSGPKSSHKPRLLSERIPVTLQTPRFPTIPKPGSSLKDQYSAQWERGPSGTHSGAYCDSVSRANESQTLRWIKPSRISRVSQRIGSSHLSEKVHLVMELPPLTLLEKNHRHPHPVRWRHSESRELYGGKIVLHGRSLL